MPTGIWDCEEEARAREAEEAEEAEEEEETALIKSNNPHLAGGEKHRSLHSSEHIHAMFRKPSDFSLNKNLWHCGCDTEVCWFRV